MKKSLQLMIDGPSWSSTPLTFRKPCPFAPTQSETTVDFLGGLVWAGVTSVPTRLPRWWIASQWAVTRYVAAADHTTRKLRLHPAVDDLDTHHKSVLSDDWGVGLALQWLATRLQYKYVVHGAFAMRELREKGVAQFVKRKKRGPSKCPDFFAVDPQDKIHLIECKGNQSGPNDTDVQFIRGKQQKQSVLFHSEALVGQRLLTGVAIAGPDSTWQSTLKVADPTPDREAAPYSIDATSVTPLIESFKRVVVVQGLIAAGASRIAHALFPKETDTEGVRLFSDLPVGHFIAQNSRWVGLIYELTFPFPIRITDGSALAGCRFRLGAAEDFLEELTTNLAPSSADQILKQRGFDLKLHTEPDSHQTDGRPIGLETPETEQIGRYAAIQHGDSLIADLELLEG
jgi:hypothetical protein